MITQILFADLKEEVEFFVRFALLIFLINYCIIMYKSARVQDAAISQKEIAKGFGNFVLAINLAQILFLVKLVYDELSGKYLFPRYIKIGGTGYEYIMMLCFALAFSFLMKPIEKYILQRERFWITKMNQIALILLLIPLIIAFLLNQPEVPIWTYLAYPGLAVFAIAALVSIFGSFLFYIRLGIQGIGEIKKKGYLIGFGMILLYLGLILVTVSFSSLIGIETIHEIMLWVDALFGPSLMVIGAVMVIAGHKLNV
jgi:hypothetical protein